MLEVMNVREYLDGCHTRAVFEAAHTTTPPSAEQTDVLMTHLRKHGLNPIVVGSAALAHHIGDIGGKKVSDVRPTMDLDVFISGPLPEPPKGWRRCTRSPGTSRWVSPSGGVVDFLEAGQEYAGGAKNPTHLNTVDAVLPGGVDYRVADQLGVWKFKLGTMRAKDLTDLALLGKTRGVPDDKKFGRLNQDQRENLLHVKMLVKHSTLAELVAMSQEARAQAEAD